MKIAARRTFGSVPLDLRPVEGASGGWRNDQSTEL